MSKESQHKKERLRDRETERQRDRAALLGQLYRDRLQRENKLDTGEDRMSQRMRRSQKIRTDCQS